MGETMIHRTTTLVNGVNIFYLDTGSSNQPMLCLHGRWGRGETWTDLMTRYRDRYRIVAPDQRGHGLSDKPEAGYAAEDFAADARELMGALDCNPSIIVGHSMGARIGAHLTAAHPEDVKALVIIDEGSGSPASFRDLPPDKIPDLDNLTKDWPTPYPTYEDAKIDIRKRFGRESNAAYFMESLVETAEGYDFMFSRRAMQTIGKCYETWDHLLSQFQCPVLLVRASNSWVLTREKAEEMKTFIKDCTYCEITQSDHMVYADNPGDFYRVFDQFLDRIR